MCREASADMIKKHDTILLFKARPPVPFLAVEGKGPAIVSRDAHNPHVGAFRTADSEFAWNRLIGWVSFVIGAGSGLVMGLWSFEGPFATPALLGDYADVSRRLARLGHIAFFGLGILNIFLARELCLVDLAMGAKRVAAAAMNLGNIFLPLTLFAAAFYHPFKYLMPVPATSVFVALLIVSYGVWRSTGNLEHAGR